MYIQQYTKVSVQRVRITKVHIPTIDTLQSANYDVTT